MTAGDIYGYLDSFASFACVSEWDNSGFLVGSPDAVVKKVLLSLDITTDVVVEAYEKGAELIVSHHPVIFTPLKTLEPSSPTYLLAKYGIAAICAHTNLDVSNPGVNTVFAEKAGLYGNISVLADDDGLAFGRIGVLCRKYAIKEYAESIKHIFNSGVVRYSKGSCFVYKVAVVGGAGGDFITLAKKAGADTLLTGEAKYHEFLFASELGLNLIDVGHFTTENPAIYMLKDLFEKKFTETEFLVSEHMDIVKCI